MIRGFGYLKVYVSIIIGTSAHVVASNLGRRISVQVVLIYLLGVKIEQEFHS